MQGEREGARACTRARSAMESEFESATAPSSPMRAYCSEERKPSCEGERE